VDWVTFRKLATTLEPRSTNPFPIPAPIPCEAPGHDGCLLVAVHGCYLEHVS
jgi:hypothetical protein